MDRTAVQRELRQRLIELLDLLTRDLIYAVVVIAELREIALDLEINDNAVLRIADGLYLMPAMPNAIRRRTSVSCSAIWLFS